MNAVLGFYIALFADRLSTSHHLLGDEIAHKSRLRNCEQSCIQGHCDHVLCKVCMQTHNYASCAAVTVLQAEGEGPEILSPCLIEMNSACACFTCRLYLLYMRANK